MTTVRLPFDRRAVAVGVVGKVLLAVLGGLLWAEAWSPAAALAEEPERPVHRLYDPALPPGAIGSRRLVANGPLSGYIQPVELRGPAGVKIAIVEEGGLGEPLEAPLLVGMNIGPVYRLRVTNIPYRPGVEVYPSLEVIDRLYPPVAKALEFPIPVELTEEDLVLAANGFFVTRVIYVEDPDEATPVQGDPRRQSWFDVPRGEDPLTAAIQLGRPVAILRIGSRIPDLTGPDGTPCPAPRVTYFQRNEYVEP